MSVKYDKLDDFITGLIQHANYITFTSEANQRIMEWKSYAAIRKDLERVIQSGEWEIHE